MASDEEKEDDVTEEPHPDKILEEVAAIIDRARSVTSTEELMTLFMPYMILASGMLRHFTNAGFSEYASEQMILTVWNKLFPTSYFNDDGGEFEL